MGSGADPHLRVWRVILGVGANAQQGRCWENVEARLNEACVQALAPALCGEMALAVVLLGRREAGVVFL